MRKLILLFVVILSNGFIFGQLFQFGPSPIKLIEKGEYIEADKRISKDILKTPEDIETNFAMSLLLIQRKYTIYNPEKSYEYILKSIKLLENMKDDRELKKLAKIFIDNALFVRYTDTICRFAMEDVTAKNTLEIYEKYLDYYQNAPEVYKKKVIESRDISAYKIACDKNTLEGYQHFITRYPDAIQNAEAIQKRNEAAYLKAKAVDEIDAYKDFAQRYPSAKEFTQAWERIHEIAFKVAERENSSSSYKKFIDDYPQSKQYPQAFSALEKRQYFETITTGDWINYRTFIDRYPTNKWKSVAQDSIYSIAMKTENLDILRYCLDNFTGLKRNNSLILYHDIFTIDGEKLTLDMFYEKYKDEILIPIKQKDYEMATLSNELNLQMPYNVANFAKYDQYIRTAAPREKAFMALQKMITPDMDAKDYPAALVKVKNYLTYFGNKNKKLVDLISFLQGR